MAAHPLDKWVCRCLAGEGGYPSAIGLPGASFKDGRWYLRRNLLIDDAGCMSAGAFQESFDSLEACALAWKQRAQRQRAFARSPQLLRFADMPRLLFWVGQGSPGALDLLQQLLECELQPGATDTCEVTDAVLSLAPKQCDSVLAQLLFAEDAADAAVDPEAAAAAAAAGGGEWQPSADDATIFGRLARHVLRHQVFALRHGLLSKDSSPAGSVRHEYGPAAAAWLRFFAQQQLDCHYPAPGVCTTEAAQRWQPLLEHCFASDAAEAQRVRAATPGRPHLPRCSCPPLAGPRQLGAAAGSASRALQIEHAHSQLCSRGGAAFHTISRIGLLPAYLNGAKAGGRWVTLRQAVARWPSLVVPALLRIPGWLPAHAAELDDWLVDADGTLLTRQEWDRHPCAEAVCAAEYSRAHTTFLDRHGPEPPCPCERCCGTIHGACEQLRARWAHRFSVCLAEAVLGDARASDVLRWGPLGAPVLLSEGSDVVVRHHLIPASSRSRPSRAAALAQQAQQTQQAHQDEAQQAQQVQQDAAGEEQLEAAALPAAIAEAEAEEAAAGQPQAAAHPPQHPQLGTMAAVMRYLAPEAAAIAAECGCHPGTVRHTHAAERILRMGLTALLRQWDYSPAVLLQQVLPVLRFAAAEAVAAHQPAIDAAAAAAAAEAEQAAEAAAQRALAQARAAAARKRLLRGSSDFEVLALAPRDAPARLGIKRRRFQQGLEQLSASHVALLEKQFPDMFLKG